MLHRFRGCLCSIGKLRGVRRQSCLLTATTNAGRAAIVQVGRALAQDHTQGEEDDWRRHNPHFFWRNSFREKKIAIIGVKVYAVGLYVDAAIRSSLAAWNGKLGSQIEQDIPFFKAVAEAPVEKSLQIVLVCDIDGETFWGALDEAVSPRLKSVGPTEQKALASFHKTFQGRPLKQGTIICLTWVQSSMMLVSISSDGSPSTVDSAIDSVAVASALFGVYFGSNPVSPSLKKSVASRLAAML